MKSNQKKKLTCPFKVAWEKVTPDVAADWLEKHNDRNRSIRYHTVTSMAQDMATGTWSPNAETISFGEDGQLDNGQHRLSAVVLSETEQWFLVARDVPKRIDGVQIDVGRTLDRGNQRSLPDLLRLHHGMKAEANVIAASCLHLARLCVQWPPMQCCKATMGQIEGVLEIWRPELRWLVEARPAMLKFRSIVLMGSLAFAHGFRGPVVERFLDELLTGKGAKALRKGVESGFFDPGGVQQRRVQGEIVLACVLAFERGKEPERLPAAEAGSEAHALFAKQEAKRIARVEALFPVMPGRMKESRTRGLQEPGKTKAHVHDGLMACPGLSEGSLRSANTRAIAEPSAKVSSTNWQPTEAARRLLSRLTKAA